MAEKTGDKTGEGVGCLILLALAGAIIWAVWNSAFGCLLADNFDYVTNACALSHLRKPACNIDQDILEVDEVKDVSTNDAQGHREEVRSIIYKFRKRPTSGPVSDAVMRDTASMFKLKDGTWIASCENLQQK